ncbi:MAG: DNA polymerase III subunit delta [Gammaproteobacteria bacterium]|nr:DNA polymerase III subunit delta [Gammaproteobacteria bacterium]MCH9715697.1 DNA polymerase III subunit delta [Gammaproteobacteria bacterium]MCH9762930.1 DNA polymerase III subunit delta [Gammaproteobacteria bacterium]
MIKYPDASFETHLKTPLAPIYVLMGQDSFLLNNAALALKKAWREEKNTETEEKRMSLEHANDWGTLIQEACSYSLFSEQLILDASWNKKSLDTKAKNTLKDYTENPSMHCLVILRAPLITAKQSADLSKYPNLQLISITSLNAGAQINWIKQQLKQQHFTYTDDIPKHIQTYTQGNLHAANQTIERLSLAHEPHTELSLEIVEEQLLDQRQYKLYEISGACLDGNPKKALELTQRAQRDQTEPTLLLWLITQELRLLEQLATGSSHQTLRIYSFRTQQYQRASKRLSRDRIYQLIKQSQAMDIQIKSGNSKNTWIMLEQLILAFSMPQAFASNQQ